jgi:hypothetical protein
MTIFHDEDVCVIKEGIARVVISTSRKVSSRYRLQLVRVYCKGISRQSVSGERHPLSTSLDFRFSRELYAKNCVR